MYIFRLNRSPQPHQRTALFTQHSCDSCLCRSREKYKPQTVDTCQDVHALSQWLNVIISHEFHSPVSYTSVSRHTSASTNIRVSWDAVRCAIWSTLLSRHKSLPLGIVIAGTLCVSVVVSTPFALSENGLDRSIMDICSRLPLALHIYYLHPNMQYATRNMGNIVLLCAGGPYLVTVQNRGLLFRTSKLCIFVEDIKLTLLTLFQFTDIFRNEMKMSWCTALQSQFLTLKDI